jgi:hypothetical protein
MEHYAFSGSDVDLCFNLAFLLNVFEPGGIIFALFGNRPAVLYGTVFIAVGTIAMIVMLGLLSAERWPGSADVWLLACCFGSISHGSAVIYTNALFSAIYSFDNLPGQGVAIGLVSSGFGLSPAMWISIYRMFFEDDLRGFFAFFGLAYAMAILVFTCLIYVPPPAGGSMRMSHSKTV